VRLCELLWVWIVGACRSSSIYYPYRRALYGWKRAWGGVTVWNGWWGQQTSEQSWGPDSTAWTHNTCLPDVTLSTSMWLPDYVWGCLLLHLATSASAIILHHTSLDAPIEKEVLPITFADTKISEELVKVRIFWLHWGNHDGEYWWVSSSSTLCGPWISPPNRNRWHWLVMELACKICT